MAIKDRAQPKIWLRKEINNPKNKREIIGQIMCVSYLTGTSSSHLEFEISNKNFRKRGIMSLEVKKYLKYLKKCGVGKLLAVVKIDNIASIKILEENNFIKISKVRNNFWYVIDLTFTRQEVIKIQELIFNNFNHEKKCQ